ncbi:DUF1569 domain-containing protein [Pontimicrobium sp. IMCC45349]|uniref:DUF1569 domain-containing protein n=1 Tax=Pontimicrobium sp. IMCC45349 TaxID=3391574 RepID=UPI0039A2BF57
MKSLFDKETQKEVLNRLELLNENSKANWGTMNIDQMLKHCQGPLEVAIGKKELNAKIGFMKKLLFKAFKPTMYNDKLWNKGIPTARDYVASGNYDFNQEKQQLQEVINEFSALNNKTSWPKHPFFGSFTTEQWGKAQYKHLDHHFRQFGV